MRQKTVITKLLQSVTEVYHKVRQALQTVTDSYYKVRQLLQSATVTTKRDVTPLRYYKTKLDQKCIDFP